MSEARPAHDSPSEIALDKAQHYAAIGRHRDALGELNGALARDPEDPELHFHRALALLALREVQDAEHSVRETLRLVPEFARAHGVLGLITMDRGEHVQAEQHLLQGLRLAPGDEWLYVQYARLMYKTGNHDKSRRLLDKALELDPESGDAHELQALLAAEHRQKGRALHHGQRGVALAPEDDASHAALGITFFATGHPFRARRCLREALRLDPADSDLEQAFLQADRCCRWIYLPMYYTHFLLERLPGRQFTLWGLFIVLVIALNRLGASAVAAPIAIAYLGFCIYTWVAAPLARLWIRLVPPR